MGKISVICVHQRAKSKKISMGRLPGRPFKEDGGVVAFAHRGGSELWPENTMLAYRNAVEMGVDALEIDIHGTADGELVVIHDATVDRVTEGTGPVNQFTLAELKLLDAGYRWTNDGGRTFPFRGQGVAIPTLAEVFMAFPDRWINIDIKQHEPSIVRPFVQLIRNLSMEKQVMVGSFDTDTVTRFRRLCPEAATAATLAEVIRLLLLNWLRLDRWFYRGGAQGMQISEMHRGLRLVRERFVRACRRHGMALHIWTVDEEADMRRLLDLGVDGLMSDRPDRMLRVLGRSEAEI